jgi:hypothetical protein
MLSVSFIVSPRAEVAAARLVGRTPLCDEAAVIGEMI